MILVDVVERKQQKKSRKSYYVVYIFLTKTRCTSVDEQQYRAHVMGNFQSMNTFHTTGIYALPILVFLNDYVRSKIFHKLIRAYLRGDSSQCVRYIQHTTDYCIQVQWQVEGTCNRDMLELEWQNIRYFLRLESI